MSDVVEQQDPHNFASLKAYLKEIISRGGDSDMDDDLAGVYVNAAEKFLVDEIGMAPFLNVSDTLTLPGGDSEYTMDLNIRDVYSFRDESNLRPLAFIERNLWNLTVTAADSGGGGQPSIWTKFDYARRTNVGSPAQPYGAIKVHFYPAPGSDTVLQYDAQLKAGCMVLDSDFPVVPIEYHFGLIEIAALHAGAYDFGSKAFQQHERLAMKWVRNAVRAERRSIQGNPRLMAREEVNRIARANTNPLTRMRQLGR